MNLLGPISAAASKLAGAHIRAADDLITAISGAAGKIAGLYPKLPSKCRPTCLLAMSTSNAGGAQDLTQEEQILHHHSAMIKRDLEAYHAYSRSRKDWTYLFKKRLACFILAIHFYKSFSDSFRRTRWTFMPPPVTQAQTSPFAFIRYY
jgi:hypothetical protein